MAAFGHSDLFYFRRFVSYQVNFMISSSTVLNRKTRSDGELNRISESEAELYRDLAQASGGLAIEVTKSELPVATSIITQSSSSSLVISQRSFKGHLLCKIHFFMYVIHQHVYPLCKEFQEKRFTLFLS